MLNRENNELLIFDSFQIDQTLQKHRRSVGDNRFERMQDGGVTPDVSWTITSPSGGIVPASDARADKKGAFHAIRKMFSKSKRVKETPPTISVIEFFDMIKHSMTAELGDDFDKRRANYMAAVTKATAMGQAALADRLRDSVKTTAAECAMYAAGIKQYVEESKIVEFYKKCEKGIRLDWIKNYARIIPDDVIASKVRADEAMQFDNYVVMHYDPDAKSFALTQSEAQKEKEKKRDPILFGVIEKSRRLYFIADWKDEHCDLTLDDIVKMLGTDAVTPITETDFSK